jgi:glycosyltransferase involved in cell wall biosynthesis
MSTHNSKNKLAIFIPATAVGGAEHYVNNILEFIQNLDFKVVLILPKIETVINFFSSLEVEYLIADISWSGGVEDLDICDQYINKLSWQFKEAITVLDSIKPDKVFLNLPWVDFGLGISLACHERQIPCINLVHLCPWTIKLNALTKQIFQILASTTSTFCTVSKDNQIQLSLSTGISPKWIKVFYNSRDINSEYISLTSRQYKLHRLELLDELELPFKSFLSVSVGRFSHQKNFLDIITSFARVHSKLPDYYHIFLGDGELKKYYETIVTKLGLSSKIKFLGYRKDVLRFLALSDLFISTSLYEGLALNILEAAQFSCPIVATNSSSAREIIPSSDYGLLYNPGQYHLLEKYIEFAYFYPNEMKAKAKKLKLLCNNKFSLANFQANLQSILKYVREKKDDHYAIPVTYNEKTSNLIINNDWYKRQTNDIFSYKIKQYDSEKDLLPKSFIYKYVNKILKDNYHKYLHALCKISKNFKGSKVILCFNSFDRNLFRSCYLKEEYLLFLISTEKKHYVTLDLRFIDKTYWGQDLEPNCLVKFTSFEKIINFNYFKNIDSKTQDDYHHYYTSMFLLNSYLKLAGEYCNHNNLTINLKLIDQVFMPKQYYCIEKNKDTNSVNVKLVRSQFVE